MDVIYVITAKRTERFCDLDGGSRKPCGVSISIEPWVAIYPHVESDQSTVVKYYFFLVL